MQAVITMAKRKTRSPAQPAKPEQTTAPNLLGKTGDLATFEQIRAALKPRYEIFSLKEVMRRWAAFTLDIESRWGKALLDYQQDERDRIHAQNIANESANAAARAARLA